MTSMATSKDEGDSIGEGEQEQKRKKKTSRACIHCQKSHMPCDEGRPCQRCIKRKIADSCRDGRRKKAKYLADVYDLLDQGGPVEIAADGETVINGDSAGGKPSVNVNTLPITPPEGFPSVHIGESLSSKQHQQQQQSPQLEPTIAPVVQARSGRSNNFGSQTANQEYSILSNIIRTTSDAFLSTSSPSSLMTDEEGDPSSNGASISMNNLVDSQYSQENAQDRMTVAVPGLFDDDLFNGGISSPFRDPDEVYRAISTPYPYTHEFHGLISYLKGRFDKAHLLVVARAMAAYRPSFIANTKRLKEADLIFMEQCFQRTLIDFEKIIAVSGTPTVVWRRTGKIVAVGEEFCLLTEWPRSKLVAADRFIVELMDDNSVTDYFDVFSRLAFGDSRGVTMTECTLLKPNGARLQTACTWTVRRDVFDIPMMIIGNFLPILQ